MVNQPMGPLTLWLAAVLEDSALIAVIRKVTGAAVLLATSAIHIVLLINNSRHDWKILRGGSDAPQCVGDSVFECELGSNALCSITV